MSRPPNVCILVPKGLKCVIKLRRDELTKAKTMKLGTSETQTQKTHADWKYKTEVFERRKAIVAGMREVIGHTKIVEGRKVVEYRKVTEGRKIVGGRKFVVGAKKVAAEVARSSEVGIKAVTVAGNKLKPKELRTLTGTLQEEEDDEPVPKEHHHKSSS